MKNKSISDYVAATMDAVLNSAEHKALFNTQYKFAQDYGAAKDSFCGKHGKMDSCAADDQAAKKKKEDSDDSSYADDHNDYDTSKGSSSHVGERDHGEYSDHFKADDQDAKKKKDSSEDSSSADDLEVSAAFDVAIDSLITASAALDAVGLANGSSLTLKIASKVVEAKKKEKDSKKSKKDSKDSKDSKKSSKDSMSAKDKKSDSKKSDPKKSDKKDDKKSSSKSSSKPSSKK